jgi:hypothetical protein
MKTSYFTYAFVSLLTLLTQTYVYAAGIVVNNKMHLSVNSGSLFLFCNDIAIRDGGTVTLQTGAIYNAGTFTIDDGGTLVDGSGMITLCGIWDNNSSFVKDANSTIMFDTENSISDAAIGTGDTDGDGIVDYQDNFPFDPSGDDTNPGDDDSGGGSGGGSGGSGCFIATLIP